ncbi:MAG: hypothetical protein HY079_11500 [Elusimicrobia bacterium]|nr:hypothetical protein [Elusimicrobiota bacterium]
MPRHHLHQPLRNGFTVLELVIGVAMAGLISLVMARMLLMLVRTAQYEQALLASLASAREALLYKGADDGLLWAVQRSSGAAALDPAGLALIDDAATAFALAPAGLQATRSGAVRTQADGVVGLAVEYYGAGPDGLIVRSTDAAGAGLAAFTVTVRKRGGKDYAFRSAAWMRNR